MTQSHAHVHSLTHAIHGAAVKIYDVEGEEAITRIERCVRGALAFMWDFVAV